MKLITGRLIIATHNPGKLREMAELLSPYGIEAVSADALGLAEPAETGASFAANAETLAAGGLNGNPLAFDELGRAQPQSHHDRIDYRPNGHERPAKISVCRPRGVW